MKRLLTLLLSAAMVITLTPAVAFADGGYEIAVMPQANEVSDTYGVTENERNGSPGVNYPEGIAEIVHLMKENPPEVEQKALTSAAQQLGESVAGSMTDEYVHRAGIYMNKSVSADDLKIVVEPFMYFSVEHFGANSEGIKSFTLSFSPRYKAYLTTADLSGNEEIRSYGSDINAASTNDLGLYDFDYHLLHLQNLTVQIPVPEDFGNDGRAYVEHNGKVYEAAISRENGGKTLSVKVPDASGLFTFSESNPPDTIGVDYYDDQMEHCTRTENYPSLQEAVDRVPDGSDPDSEICSLKLLSDSALSGGMISIPAGKSVEILINDFSSIYEQERNNNQMNTEALLKKYFNTVDGYTIDIENTSKGGFGDGYTISSIDSSQRTGFSDVSSDAWYSDAVNWAVDSGITSGTGDTTFSPDAACTRAQMATFLWRMSGEQETGGDSGFSDVAADSWYADAVAWVKESNITSGTSATTFSPDAPCTRAQMAVFLWRMAGSPDVSGNSGFGDVASDAYYAQAVQWAKEAGVTSGTTDTTFSPDAACTRAQMVTFLYRYNETN